jgi:hypothetical protein
MFLPALLLVACKEEPLPKFPREDAIEHCRCQSPIFEMEGRWYAPTDFIVALCSTDDAVSNPLIEGEYRSVSELRSGVYTTTLDPGCAFQIEGALMTWQFSYETKEDVCE